MKKALIVLLAVAFVGAFALPAMAADKTEWGFYGSARVGTWSYDDDKMSGLVPNGGVNGFDDRDTTWALQGNSRFGANASAGAVSGRVEIRETSEFRVMWGEWNFGPGKLGVGKNYTPANMFYSQQAGFGDANLLNIGGYYTGADGMIRLSFDNIADMFSFDLAFVEPTVVPDQSPAIRGLTPAQINALDADTTLPQIEGRFLFNWGPVQMEMGGAWVEFTDTAIVGGAERDYDLDAWALHMGIKYAMGPFYANGNIHTGENNTYLGQWTYSQVVATYDAGNDTMVDADHWGWNLIAGFNLNDMLSFEAGYGETDADYNMPGLVEDETASYYMQARISPAAGVFIIPEIGKRDYKNTTAGVDQGDTFYFGATWRINF